MRVTCLLVCAAAVSLAQTGAGGIQGAVKSTARAPLRVHPANPRYFTDGTKGPDGSLKAVYLTGSHVWNNFQDVGTTNPPPAFDFDAYLDTLQKYRHNFIRLWRWELTEWKGWDAKQAPLRYGVHHPWKRSGTEKALDGLPKFDLAQWDERHFDRLRSRVQAAGKRGIYVSVMLFEGWCLRQRPSAWAGHPMNSANNINGINGDPDGDGLGLEVQMLQVPAITALQKAYIRKVIDAVNDLDNVLYEISNESLDLPAIRSWQAEMIHFINQYQAGKPKQHPVGMTSLIAYSLKDKIAMNDALLASPADWVSPGSTIWGPGDPYSINPPATKGQKVELLDSDHTWNNACMSKSTQLRADSAWVWKSFLRGYNPIYMDPLDLSRPSTVLEYVDGNTAAVLSARKAMGQTRAYAERMDLGAMTPQDALASTGYCLAKAGKAYLVYQPASKAAFTVSLQAGAYDVEWFDPSAGKTVTAGSFAAEAGDRSFLAPFAGEAVLYLEAANASGRVMARPKRVWVEQAGRGPGMLPIQK